MARTPAPALRRPLLSGAPVTLFSKDGQYRNLGEKLVEKITVSTAREGLGKAWKNTSAQLTEQIGSAKDTARDAAEKLASKAPDPYAEAIAAYNAAFAALNDSGLALLRQRERSTDLIELVEHLVNGIANTPKSFQTTLGEIKTLKSQFLDAEDFARRDLLNAKTSGAGAGAGLAAGATVAGVAPTAAIWVATTFGTASTGTAISALSGAAASNAALAWLGGGALAAGGGGTAAGGALLALAGPIGWSVAGASLVASMALFAKKKLDNRAAKQEALSAVKRNTAQVMSDDAQVENLLEKTTMIRTELVRCYRESLVNVGADFGALPENQQRSLGILVNNTKSCAAVLGQRIETGAGGE